HGHYTPPKPYRDLFSQHREGLILPQDTHRSGVLRRLKAGNLSQADIHRMKGLYDAEIRYTDDSLGGFLLMLKQLGLGEETIVVLTADHGEEFFDHGGFEHGHTLYRELIRVPLIINSPGLVNKRITHPVELIDIYPLLLDLTGLEITHTLEGESLLAENYSKKLVYSETDMHAKLSMVRDGSVKVIHNWATNETLMFNLDVDVGEKKPIKPDNQSRRKYLKLIESYRKDLFTPTESANISQQTMQRLREAGYLT
ncbi:MAG: sulfatase-like hydrolase/transferase, partial [Candidatus Altiarchaeales archaeon]|nr:sulfatase-like hydrolase/transferase [Candidatus Altiarchaeales archaeon]